MAILDEVLKSVCDGLEAALQAAEARAEPWVVLSNLTGPDGSPAPDLDGRIVVGLLALQANMSAFKPPGPQPGDGWRHPPAPLRVDADIIALANFSGRDYSTGLAMISRVIAYFQERPVLTSSETPGLPVGVDKVAIEFVGLDLATAATLLPAGLRTLPFALYRLRGLPFGQARL
jgi:Pvc16 N-terminal domain